LFLTQNLKHSPLSAWILSRDLPLPVPRPPKTVVIWPLPGDMTGSGLICWFQQNLFGLLQIGRNEEIMKLFWNTIIGVIESVSGPTASAPTSSSETLTVVSGLGLS